MSLKLPGANNQQEYWELLLNKEIKRGPIPKHRHGWEIQKQEKAIGAYLEDIDMFDPSIFRISPREAALIDPQARILYEQIWKSLENAGIAPVGESAGKTGLFIAYSHDHYYEERLRCNIKEGRGLGLSAMIANRLSFALDWHGPSKTINTLCSSSLVAIHEAIQSLRSGEIEVAVVGGVNLGVSSSYYSSMCSMGVISSKNRCSSFDETADGTIPGEGAVSIVLRRYDKAITRNEPILALIKGSAIGHGGLSTRYSAPNPKAQAEVITSALSDAKVKADKVGLVEAHATGTILGDPIEIDGLKKVWANLNDKSQICGLGSVKSNIGHLESASGLAGVAKVILAIQKKVLPPTAGITRPNNLIKFESSPFFLVDRPTQWPEARPFAGVSAFGMGGVNAHLILAPVPVKNDIPVIKSQPNAFICKISATTVSALRCLARLYAESIEGLEPWQVVDFCFTANTARADFKYCISVGGSLEEIITDLYFIANKKELNPIVFVPNNKVEIKNLLAQMSADEARAVSKQHNQGYLINWERLYNKEENKVMTIPNYPFEEKRYWLDEPLK